MGYDFFKEDKQDLPEQLKQEKPVGTAEMHENEKKDLFAIHDEIEQEEREKADVERGTQALENPEVGNRSEKVELEEEKVEEKKAVEEAIKKIHARYNEEQLDIPAEAMFKHKVDGEEVEVGLQDLLNNYSGKVAYDKKFSELDKERNVYKEDLELVNKYIGEFGQKSKEDPIAAFEFLAQFAGADPLQFRRQLRDQMIQKYSPYLQMAEEERRVMDLKEENEYFRKLQESEANKRAQQQAQAELEGKFRSMQEANGISDDRRSELINDLMQHGNMQNVSPEDVLALHQAYERQDLAFAALEAVNSEFVKDESKIVMVESLLSGNPQLSKDDLQNHIAKLWGNDVEKAVANLSKKAEISKPKKEEKPHNFQPKILSTGKVDFFS
jgi:hypothetical protein